MRKIVQFDGRRPTGKQRPGGTGVLTPREAECLRLLASGYESREVARRLDIKPSTLNRHLFAARRKLGVGSTRQAVLQFLQERQANRDDTIAQRADHGFVLFDVSPVNAKLADDLRDCRTFEEAWGALHRNLEDLGVAGVTFGVIGDPNGEIDESSSRMFSSFPEEIWRSYEQIGGVTADFVARHVATSTEARAFDVKMGRSLMEGAEMFDLMLDNGIETTLCLPARDPLTGAPFGFNLALTAQSDLDLETHGERLAQAIEIFWLVVQHKRLMADTIGLTPVECEALKLIATGFSVADLAARRRMSRRSAEKILSRIRQKLGARNNAQAVYRAMVYRALPD